ncbi:MAG: peptide chain release factor 2 [Armatimonadota bacterium]
MLKEVIDKVRILKANLEELGGHLDLANKLNEISKLEALSGENGFWDDPTTAQATLKKISGLKAVVQPFNELNQRLEDLELLAEMVDDDTSEDADDLRKELNEIQKSLDKLELDTLLSGEYDSANAILEVNSGAGGTEACDWADMLLRMYLRWAERNGFKAEIINQVPGDVAGSKNATILIEGRNVYGYLKTERGVHRLVRISPFDSNKRRHTSFAAVDVIPDLDDSISVNINPDDIKVDTYRASGAGGQHVNKTDSAVRITHIPTGIVVTCQNERSQHKNRENALKVLAGRLAQLEQEENEKKLSELRGDVRAIEWGSQIRSYVFQPYTMVKDHRTNHETGDVIRVMDGEIDDFIQASLKMKPAN